MDERLVARRFLVSRATSFHYGGRMLVFMLAMFACGEDEETDSGSDDTAVEEEVEATVRYH